MDEERFEITEMQRHILSCMNDFAARETAAGFSDWMDKELPEPWVAPIDDMIKIGLVEHSADRIRITEGGKSVLAQIEAVENARQ